MFSKKLWPFPHSDGQNQHLFPGCQPSSRIPHQIQSTQARLSVLIRRSARNFRVTRHPTGIADSTLPSLWSNADFRRANIDTLRRRLHNPLPRGGVAAEQVVSALAVDVIDGLHSTASGRFFAWVIGGALSAALDADWLTAAWDQNAYNYVTGPAAALVEECEPQTACGH